jgi:membrane protein
MIVLPDRITRVRTSVRYLVAVIKTLFRKYQRDNANIIVSSISFYILLTFIPFTLLSIYILGYVIDMSSPAIHLEKYIKNVIPDPYNTVVVKKVIRELNIISITKKLSGPLGVLFLYFFATRLFAIIRPSFRIIFGKSSTGFIKGKGEEFLLTILFSLVQAVIFFSFVFSIVIQTKMIKVLPGFIAKNIFAYAFLMVEMSLTFAQFIFLYYFLTPVRDKTIIIISTITATVGWHLGRHFFKHFIIYLSKVTTFFGTYGVFIAVLFWVYFSVFVFILCAELLSILAKPASHGLPPNSFLSGGLPSMARTKRSCFPSLR